MRLLCLCLVLLAQERATVITPKPVDATVRSYEITGFSVTIPSSVKPPAGPFAGPPTTFMLAQTPNVTIRYVDNLGTEYVDAHTDPATTAPLISELFEGSGPIRARLLKHLIDEKKIPSARITK